MALAPDEALAADGHAGFYGIGGRLGREDPTVREDLARVLAEQPLRDEELALPETGVGAEPVHAAAHHHGGIEAARAQHRGHHRGGGGLAVGARDRDAVLQPHQLGEHLGPRDDRDAALTCGRYFHVVARHRGGVDDHVRPLHVGGGVALVDLGPQPLEPLHRLAAPGVGAGDPVAEREQDLGDAAHADAADAHEVDVLVLLEH